MRSLVTRFFLVAAFVIVLGGASAAYADSILNYNVSGPNGTNGFVATFSLPQGVAPDGGGPLSFWYNDVAVTINGTQRDLTVVFDSSWAAGGVLGINSFYLIGPQLFTWDSGKVPTLLTGDFTLFGIGGNYAGLFDVNVNASRGGTPSRVPEPNTIAFMTANLIALVGMRLRKKTA